MIAYPVLPGDTTYYSVGDGLQLTRGPARILVRGRDIAERFREIAPSMTGEKTLGNVLGARNEREASESAMGRFLLKLIDRKILINWTKADRSKLSPDERARWASQLAFLSHYVESPFQRFITFREARIGLLGSGELRRALVRSVRSNGLRKIENLRGGSRIVNAESDDRLALQLERQIGNYDAICYAADWPDLHFLSTLAITCKRVGVPLLVGTVLNSVARIGPIQISTGPCWNCALLRIGEGASSIVGGMMWRSVATSGSSFLPSANAYLSVPALRIAGTALAFQIFRYFTGMEEKSGRGAALLETIEGSTLESSSVALLWHPACACRIRRSTKRGSHRSEGLATMEKVERALVNGELGVFAAFDDDRLDQAPVFRSRLRTQAHDESGERVSIEGSSLTSNQQARWEALLAAACHYTAALYGRLGWGMLPRTGVKIGSTRTTVYGSLPSDGRMTVPAARRSLRVELAEPAMALDISAGAFLPMGADGGFVAERWQVGFGAGLSALAAAGAARASLVGFLTARAAYMGKLQFGEVRDWLPKLAPYADLLRSINPTARAGEACIEDVWVVCISSAGAEDTVLVAHHDREEALAQCLAEGLAVMSNGNSERTLRRWLPDFKEYDAQRDYIALLPMHDPISLRALLRLDANVEIGHAEVTSCDLQAAGLYIYRAVCLVFEDELCASV